jgi:hypothetical protein
VLVFCVVCLLRRHDTSPSGEDLKMKYFSSYSPSLFLPFLPPEPKEKIEETVIDLKGLAQHKYYFYFVCPTTNSLSNQETQKSA